MNEAKEQNRFATKLEAFFYFIKIAKLCHIIFICERKAFWFWLAKKKNKIAKDRCRARNINFALEFILKNVCSRAFCKQLYLMAKRLGECGGKNFHNSLIKS